MLLDGDVYGEMNGDSFILESLCLLENMDYVNDLPAAFLCV